MPRCVSVPLSSSPSAGKRVLPARSCSARKRSRDQVDVIEVPALVVAEERNNSLVLDLHPQEEVEELHSLAKTQPTARKSKVRSQASSGKEELVASPAKHPITPRRDCVPRSSPLASAKRILPERSFSLRRRKQDAGNVLEVAELVAAVENCDSPLLDEAEVEELQSVDKMQREAGKSKDSEDPSSQKEKLVASLGMHSKIPRDGDSVPLAESSKRIVPERSLRKRKEDPVNPPEIAIQVESEASQDSPFQDLDAQDEDAELQSLDKTQRTAEKLKADASENNIKKKTSSSGCYFIGELIPNEEARRRWPHRYVDKRSRVRSSKTAAESSDGGETVFFARQHYCQCVVDGVVFNLLDDAFVKGSDGEPDFIGRIVEFFKGIDGEEYFTAQWFYRAQDTVIKDHANLIDDRRVFLSEIKDENLLDCIVSKVKIVQVSPNVNLQAKERKIPTCDFYYDMFYSVPYSMFSTTLPDNLESSSGSCSSITTESEGKSDSEEQSNGSEAKRPELALLDLYSGCGAMSTGLCLGAGLSGVNLVTRWSVDINEYACQSLQLNHPETHVRNESADDFLVLIREWEKLCKQYHLIGTKRNQFIGTVLDENEDLEEVDDDYKLSPGEFEVAKLVGICYGDPTNCGKRGLKFKVRWKGYGPNDDTWEPIEGLSDCQERIKEFVVNGFKRNILPVPGMVDVICGGPPCQGISGFNRFRNAKAPLEDPKNHQMVVFMDIVDYLKPKYVLMENVVDILKFAGGFLGRYALARLVHMNYQAKLGLMAAGSYGLPQFRMRVFLWGAHPDKKLPSYPLPTHDVVVRGIVPNEFEQNVVGYDESQPHKLKDALLLGDAISDLPAISNDEEHDEMPYGKPPQTEFQRYIRASRPDLPSCTSIVKKMPTKGMLLDHQPLQLNMDDYLRVKEIPKRKGANFRDLPGVLVGPDNVVQWDPNLQRVLLPSGKPLVPDYAMSFVKGRSTKPFGRLWWDETVPTVVTRAEPHNQVIIHPVQDRVLSIRENARLQGFPDYYKLCGPIKERYIQVGNAVAVPVARALGYALGLAHQGMSNNQPVMILPTKFPHSLCRVSCESAEIEVLNENS